MLALFGISASNAKAQNLGRFTVNKDFCASIGATNTCNGKPASFPDNVQFTVEQGTFDQMTNVFTPATGGTPFANISVDIKSNAKGSTTTGDIFTVGATFRVCEVTPLGFVSLPRPGSTSGGSNQFTGSAGCLVITNINSGNSVLNFLNGPASPTAASVTVRGRVLSPFGRGVSRARVMMTNSIGETVTVMTNPFGFYTFGNIEVGDTYILQVRDKRYTFTPQALSLTEEATDVNFTAQR